MRNTSDRRMLQRNEYNNSCSEHKLTSSNASNQPLTLERFALEHCTETPVRLDSFARGAVISCGLAMTKGEANEKALAHLFFPIGHALQGLLFVMDLFILRHVSFIAEVIKIPRVGFRVKFRDKRSF